MIFAEHADGSAQPIENLGDLGDLGFSFGSITSALSSVVGAAKGAVSAVGKAACQAVPAAATASKFAPTQYASTIAKGQQVASGICSQFGPKPAAPAPVAPIKPLVAQAIPMAPAAAAAAAPVAPVSKYPAGSIQRFNVTRGVWVIYKPAFAPMQGLGYAYTMGDPCLGGDCSGLGQDEKVEPPVPAGMVKAGESATPEPGVQQAGQEKSKPPLYKQPLFWGAIGLGVLAAGTGTWLVMRRRRTA